MAKPNSKPMKVSSRFHEVMKNLNKRTQVPIIQMTDNLGKQLEEQLREERNFQPRLPSIKLRKLTKDKKGSAVDVIFVMISLFVLALAFLMTTKVWNNVDDKVAHHFNDSATGREAVAKVNAVINSLDNYFLIILMLGAVAMIVLASMIRIDPIFYWVFFFIFIIGLIMAAVFSNTYERVAATPALEPSSTGFDVQNFVMGNLPIIFLVLAVILLIVIYGKTRSGV